MQITKTNTANPETEEQYVRIVTLYLDMQEEENKQKYFNPNRKEK